MQHRHLTHERYTLAAIDDIIARGKRRDWAELRLCSTIPFLEAICRTIPGLSASRRSAWLMTVTNGVIYDYT